MTGEALALLRAHDTDRYLALQFAPPSQRADLAGLFALDIELTRVEALVSEPLIGELRLTWWRDSLANPKASTGNPIADCAARAIATHGLAQPAIETLIEARRQDLYDQPIADIAELANYFTDTTGSVLAMACQVLGQQEPVDDLCARAALISGLTRLAGGLARGRVRRVSRLVPVEVLTELPVSEPAPRQDLAPAAQAALLRALLGHAGTAWREAQDRFRQIPQSLIPVFLPLALVNGDLLRFSRSSPATGAYTTPVPKYRRVLRLAINGRRARIV